MNKHIQDIDERKASESEFMDEVLSEPPRWIVRWGEVWVFIFLLSLLLLAALVRYPDRLAAEAMITTSFPPVEIKAPISGHIENLFVNDLKQVHEHDVLLTMGNDYHWEDVLFVENQLLVGMHPLDTSALNQLFSARLNVGPLQALLENAHAAFQNYLLEMKLQPAFQQQLATQEEIRQLELLIDKKEKQQLILKQQLSISQKDFERHRLLHQKQAIADSELEAKENNLLDARQQVQAMTAEIQKHQLAKTRLEKEMILFSHQNLQDAKKSQHQLLISLQKLKAELTAWKEKYIIKAPKGGKISFFSQLYEKQFVEQDEVLLHIIPNDESAIQAKLMVPTANFGKVATGQKVRLALHNYPENEFGWVEGKVERISSMPQDGYYQVTASFPMGLKTSYGVQIPFSQNLGGRAEIITQDISLLMRFTKNLRF